MKQLKIFSLIAILITGLSLPSTSMAQRQKYKMVAETASSGTFTVKTLDTVVNVDTTYLYFSTDGLTLANTDGSSNYFCDMEYYAAVTNITGTTGGTVIFQGSMTGNPAIVGDWVTLISDVTQYNGASSLTVSSLTSGATTWMYFILPKVQFKYVRARFISSGTQTASVAGTAWVLPHG